MVEDAWFDDLIKECSEKHARIDEGVRSVIHDNACRHFQGFGNFVIGRSVVITEVIDQVGDTHLVSFASPALRQWEVLGMIEYISQNMMQERWA